MCVIDIKLHNLYKIEDLTKKRRKTGMHKILRDVLQPPES